MTINYLFSKEYPLKKDLFFLIETPHNKYSTALQEIVKAGPLTYAIFELCCIENYYKKTITIARLYEHILPQEEVYKAEGMLVNNDEDIALRLLYDPRIKF